MQILWYSYTRMKAILPKFTMQCLWLNFIYFTSSILMIQAASPWDDPRYWGCFDAPTYYYKLATSKEAGINWCRQGAYGIRYAYVGIKRGNIQGCYFFNKTYWTRSWTREKCSYDCPKGYDWKPYEKCGADWVNSIYRVCEPHKFGWSCEHDCHCTDDKTLHWKKVDCNPVTGECRWGGDMCESGWWDWPRCQKRCYCWPAGSRCDKVTGKCVPPSTGCAPGYRGFPTCKEECRRGYYGVNCREQCPRCLNFECDRVSGECSKCPAGYRGDHCQEYCEAGSWGYECKENCSGHCAHNTTCHPALGTCGNSECQEGWTGKGCELPIVPTQEPSKPSTQELSKPSTQELSKPSTQELSKPSTQEPYKPSTQEPSKPSTQEPSKPSTQEPYKPSTQEPSKPSTPKPSTPKPSAPKPHAPKPYGPNPSRATNHPGGCMIFILSLLTAIGIAQ